jgi:hypothetical protein
MQKLVTYLSEVKTDPKIQDALVSCVSSWRGSRPILPGKFAPKVQPIIHQQHTIGWQHLLEGLPGIQWRQGQQHFYDSQRIRKSSKKWLRGTLAWLMQLSKGQWFHRNDEKHVQAKPRHKKAQELLRKAIIWLYSKRTRELLPGDHSKMDINLCNLLRQSTSYRQAWYINVVTVRNRCLRVRHNDPELEDPPPFDQDIRLWIGGRPR